MKKNTNMKKIGFSDHTFPLQRKVKRGLFSYQQLLPDVKKENRYLYPSSKNKFFITFQQLQSNHGHFV